MKLEGLILLLFCSIRDGSKGFVNSRHVLTIFDSLSADNIGMCHYALLIQILSLA